MRVTLGCIWITKHFICALSLCHDRYLPLLILPSSLLLPSSLPPSTLLPFLPPPSTPLLFSSFPSLPFNHLNHPLDLTPFSFLLLSFSHSPILSFFHTRIRYFYSSILSLFHPLTLLLYSPLLSIPKGPSIVWSIRLFR
jgi:hypothetical protein